MDGKNEPWSDDERNLLWLLSHEYGLSECLQLKTWNQIKTKDERFAPLSKRSPDACKTELKYLFGSRVFLKAAKVEYAKFYVYERLAHGKRKRKIVAPKKHHKSSESDYKAIEPTASDVTEIEPELETEEVFEENVFGPTTASDDSDVNDYPKNADLHVEEGVSYESNSSDSEFQVATPPSFPEPDMLDMREPYTLKNLTDGVSYTCDIDSIAVVTNRLSQHCVDLTMTFSVDARRAYPTKNLKIVNNLLGHEESKWFEFKLGLINSGNYLNVLFQRDRETNIGEARKIFVIRFLQRAINSLPSNSKTSVHGSGLRRWGIKKRCVIYGSDWPLIAKRLDSLMESEEGMKILHFRHVHFYQARHGMLLEDANRASSMVRSMISSVSNENVIGIQAHKAITIKADDGGAVFVSHKALRKHANWKSLNMPEPAYLAGHGHFYGNLRGYRNVSYIQSYDPEAHLYIDREYVDAATYLIGRGLTKCTKRLLSIIKARTGSYLVSIVHALEILQQFGHRSRLEVVETFRNVEDFFDTYSSHEKFVKSCEIVARDFIDQFSTINLSKSRVWMLR
ncbi:unnamed protein product [Ceutorhynchus assimilis]|uniref:Uncharacterized protein n=1 Tax=Ceutorhynchus assimilis TaxID=467358 RepID=A0A9N9MVC5_9CUCU|nr:unnamed protein product [Ceutorhynchus assimilis]